MWQKVDRSASDEVVRNLLRDIPPFDPSLQVNRDGDETMLAAIDTHLKTIEVSI